MAEPGADVVRRAQAGEAEALLALVEGYQSYVFSIARSLMTNPADAADMTQEAFIRVLRSLGSFRGETKFSSWLYRLTTNICLDELRRRGKPVASLDQGGPEDQPAFQPRDRDPWNQPEQRAVTLERADEVRAALAALPAVQRVALTLHYFEGLRYEDIAEVMHLPLNTVKSHLRRGKERLAMDLRAMWSEEQTACNALS